MRPSDVTATGVVRAPAPHVYRIIADYHDGHPRIVPPGVFTWMRVERGGIGAGTTIRFAMRIFGTTTVLTGDVTEPEPGRVLMEAYPETGVLTTFTVDPDGEGGSRVTIATRLGARRGIAAAIERWVSRRVLPGIYRDELRRLAEHAEGRRVHEPVPRA